MLWGWDPQFCPFLCTGFGVLWAWKGTLFREVPRHIPEIPREIPLTFYFITVVSWRETDVCSVRTLQGAGSGEGWGCSWLLTETGFSIPLGRWCLAAARKRFAERDKNVFNRERESSGQSKTKLMSLFYSAVRAKRLWVSWRSWAPRLNLGFRASTEASSTKLIMSVISYLCWVLIWRPFKGD